MKNIRNLSPDGAEGIIDFIKEINEDALGEDNIVLGEADLAADAAAASAAIAAADAAKLISDKAAADALAAKAADNTIGAIGEDIEDQTDIKLDSKHVVDKFKLEKSVFKNSDELLSEVYEAGKKNQPKELAIYKELIEKNVDPQQYFHTLGKIEVVEKYDTVSLVEYSLTNEIDPKTKKNVYASMDEVRDKINTMEDADIFSLAKKTSADIKSLKESLIDEISQYNAAYFTSREKELEVKAKEAVFGAFEKAKTSVMAVEKLNYFIPSLVSADKDEELQIDFHQIGRNYVQKLIESGEAEKILADEKEIIDFLIWRSFKPKIIQRIATYYRDGKQGTLDKTLSTGLGGNGNKETGDIIDFVRKASNEE